MATTLTTSYQRISTINVTYGQIRTYAKYNSQSMANNTTTISLKTTYYLSQWIEFSSGTSTLDGTSKSYGYTRFNAGETTLQEFTRTLTHNADGTSPTKTVSTSWTASFGGGGSTSAQVVAPKILRQANITAADNFTDEGNPKITYTNPAGNSVNTLMACITTASDGTIRVPYRDISKTGTSYTFNLTESERNTLRSLTPNSTTLQVKFLIRTNIGGTNLYSSVERTMTIVNGNPTFSAAYLDTNSTTTAITNNNQKIIRNNSTLQINTTNLSAKKYATLSSIKTVLNGVTYNGTISGTTATFNIGTLNVSSNTTAAVTLTDSRGLKTTQNLTIQVLDWVLPSAIITAQRENNFYNPTTINVDASYSSLDGENTLTIQMRYKKTTDSDYGSYQTLQDDTPTTVQLDNNYEWNVQVLLTDRLGTKTYNLLIERGIPIAFFDRKKRSLSIEKFPANENSLEVAGDVYVGTTANNNVINVLEKMQSRPRAETTDANITHKWENNCAHMQFLIATNSMTSNKPAGDGYIIHCGWDNSGQYVGQLFIPNQTATNRPLQFRACTNGTWGTWENLYREKVLYSNSSGTNASFTLDENYTNFTYLEILYGNSGKTGTSSCRIKTSVSGFDTSVYAASGSGTSAQFWFNSTRWSLANNNKINLSSKKNFVVNSNGTTGMTDTSSIYIYEVIGYR